MAKSAIITLTTAGADTGPFNLLSDVDSYVTPFETNIAKSSLVAGYITNLVPDAATIVRVQSSSSLCTNFINLTYPITTTTSTTTTTTTVPPTSSACYLTSFGTVPVTGGAGSYATGTITVTSGSVNVWAKYNSGGSSSGTAQFGMTVNSISATGTFTITGIGQTGYSTSGGTSAGYITLSPGTYSFTLNKTDNLTSGNEVRFSWADSSITDPTLSTNMSVCILYYTLLGPIDGRSGTSSGACANYFSSRSYYSNVNFMQSSVTYIYEDTGLTTPLDTGGQWKPLSFNGVNIYAVITNSSGMVTNYTSC